MIQLQNVELSQGGRRLLADVSLTAAPGTAFTAGAQFAMGSDAANSLTLTTMPFTDDKNARKPSLNPVLNLGGRLMQLIEEIRESLIIGVFRVLVLMLEREIATIKVKLLMRGSGDL